MAEAPRESWLNWVALTTTILAVAASLASLRGSSYSTRTTLLTTLEANQWSYFQSKSIKQHTLEGQRDLFEVLQRSAVQPGEPEAIERKLEAYRADISRYEKEKAEIKKEAESLSAQEDRHKMRSGNFGVAAMLLQIAIMMSGVSALLRIRKAWYFGMAVGGVGLVYMFNGFFLFAPLLF